MWRQWFEHVSSKLEVFEIILLLGFNHTNEMNSAIKTFNSDPYFKKINFQLESINEYQAILIGNLNR